MGKYNIIGDKNVTKKDKDLLEQAKVNEIAELNRLLRKLIQFKITTPKNLTKFKKEISEDQAGKI